MLWGALWDALSGVLSLSIWEMLLGVPLSGVIRRYRTVAHGRPPASSPSTTPFTQPWLRLLSLACSRTPVDTDTSARYQRGWMLHKTPQMPCKYLIDRRWRKPRHARVSAPWQLFVDAFTDTFTGTFTGVLASAFAHAHLEARLARAHSAQGACRVRLFCAFFI